MKGFTNNIHGRPKGVPNKVTAELRSLLHDFVTEEWEAIKSDFRQLEPKERLIYYEKLLQYCIPKNSKEANEVEAKVEQPIFLETRMYEIDLDKIPYQDLKQIIEESEVFMSKKQDSKVFIESIDGVLQLDCKND